MEKGDVNKLKPNSELIKQIHGDLNGLEKYHNKKLGERLEMVLDSSKVSSDAKVCTLQLVLLATIHRGIESVNKTILDKERLNLK